MINKDHVKQIADSMVERPGYEPHIADLIPFTATTKKLVHFENTPEDKSDFVEAIAKREIMFFAVSGQHSARAAHWIQGWAKADAKLTNIANNLRLRKSRILSDVTPLAILAEHSSRSNAINETMEFKSCFVETVLHARRQFVEMGRPSKPGVGSNQKSDNSKFNVRLIIVFLFLCFHEG